MKRQSNNYFSELHPVTCFSYLLIMLVMTMFSMNPIVIAIMLITSLINAVSQGGLRSVLKSLKYIGLMMLMIVIINPLFNHRGMTVIMILSNGNALTLEAIVYGIAVACMMAAVFLWFYTFNIVIESDKFMYLVAKLSPSLALVISMTLRFVPELIKHSKEVWQLQRILLPETGRVKLGVNTVAAMVQWSLESSIEKADSMKSRGYGTGKRSFYSIFAACRIDYAFALVMLVITGIIVGFKLCMPQLMAYSYYPVFGINELLLQDYICIFSYILLGLLPMFIRKKHGKKQEYRKNKGLES